MKSDVYFVKVKDKNSASRVSALRKILDNANPFSLCKDGEIVPVKLTLGEAACYYYLKPQLVKLIITKLKAKNVRPFLFDTSVIYKGSRQNAVDHLNLLSGKEFGQEKVGAPFIIADGLFGSDGREHEIKGKYLKKIKVPSFIGLLDSIVVLSHITGHLLAGYAGAIKNVAMGMTSRAGKQVQHSSLKPHVIKDNCTQCSCCLNLCPVRAISMEAKTAFINDKICIGCGECICACKFEAIFINWATDNLVFCLGMAEAATSILSHFKNKFFINFAFDITKECDCLSEKEDEIISADIGIFASRDIVSLDKAVIDFVNKDKDLFARTPKLRAYHKMLDYAQDLGLGRVDYNLVQC